MIDLYYLLFNIIVGFLDVPLTLFFLEDVCKILRSNLIIILFDWEQF